MLNILDLLKQKQKMKKIGYSVQKYSYYFQVH